MAQTTTRDAKTYAVRDQMRRHRHTDDLKEAAQQFLIDMFEGKRPYPDIGEVVNAAMCIVEDLSYYQPSEAQIKYNTE